MNSTPIYAPNVELLPPLRGRALRLVLTAELMRRAEMTVAQLVETLQTAGYPVEGRASKTISDALRWEVAHGRVVRVARGVYRFARAKKPTVRRIRRFSDQAQAWVVAVTRNRRPPPTPPDQRSTATGGRPANPDAPPWANLGWLWSL